MRLKQFAEVFLVGYLGHPRVVTKGTARYVFCGLSTTIREKIDISKMPRIESFLMEILGLMDKNHVVTRVETWHNLVARSKVAADSMELLRAKNRTVLVRGRLTRRSFTQDDQIRSVCEVQVFDPVLAQPGRPWTSLVDIQGRALNEPSVEFVSYTDDPRDAAPETKLKISVERSYRDKSSPSGWGNETQTFEVIWFGERWISLAREIKPGQTIRVLTTLGYDTEKLSESESVEVPLLAGLEILCERDLIAIEKGSPLPEHWARFLKVA